MKENQRMRKIHKLIMKIKYEKKQLEETLQELENYVVENMFEED